MRRRISYANVAATLALVFSMSGGALAARHYLINSTKQINPKVLKKLKGNAGPAGATGATGLQGALGLKGEGGKEGARGPSDVWQAGNAGSASGVPPLSVSVPAGGYLVRSQTVVSGGEGTSACFISGGTEKSNSYGATEKAPGITQMTLNNVETTVLSAPGTIKMDCIGAAEFFLYSKLTATQVGTVH